MIVLRMPQGSPDWFAARRGIPTASNFHKILTPKTLKPSTQAIGYASQLLAEWLTGETNAETLGGFVARGSELEQDAIDWYRVHLRMQDCTDEIDRVGFVLRDDREVGCSPDGFVGDDGDVEIKCLSAANHVRALLDPDDTDYRLQVQGRLWITGRKWCDRVYYYPTGCMPSQVDRFERDEAIIDAIADAVESFLVQLHNHKVTLIEKGCLPATYVPRPPQYGPKGELYL